MWFDAKRHIHLENLCHLVPKLEKQSNNPSRQASSGGNSLSPEHEDADEALQSCPTLDSRPFLLSRSITTGVGLVWDMEGG
jgi:hypothetical protein